CTCLVRTGLCLRQVEQIDRGSRGPYGGGEDSWTPAVDVPRIAGEGQQCACQRKIESRGVRFISAALPGLPKVPELSRRACCHARRPRQPVQLLIDQRTGEFVRQYPFELH